MGVYHLPKKIRNFRLGFKWKGYFGLPERKISEINGTCSDVVQNSQPEYPNGKCAFHFLFPLVPDLSVCIRPGGDVRGNGTRTFHGNFHSGFGASHLLPLSTNRFFRLNSKQPMTRTSNVYLVNALNPGVSVVCLV